MSQMEILHLESEWSCITSVSYTHLDVYKRQIQCFIMEDQQIRETVRKSISCLYYGKSRDILQEEKYLSLIHIYQIYLPELNL